MEKMNVDSYIDELGTTLGEELIKPTKIYTEIIQDILLDFNIKGISHITGGGFYENIPRMIPKGLIPYIDIKSIDTPPIFNIIRNMGNITIEEMYSTFNMGIGMVIAVSQNEVEDLLIALKNKGELAYIIGEVRKGEGGLKICP